MTKQRMGLLSANQDDLILLTGVIGGAFLLIHVISALALKFSGENTSILLSGILLPIFAGVVMALLGAGHVLLTFAQAVRFSQTRRRALSLAAGQIGVECALAVALCAGLSALERAFAPAFWKWLIGAQTITWGIGGRRIPEGSVWAPDLTELFIEDFAIVWWGLPCIILGAAALGFIGGAIILRFGKQGGWAIWGAWMLGCLGLPRLPWRTHEVTNVLVPALIIAGVAAFLWSVWSLLRAVIRE